MTYSQRVQVSGVRQSNRKGSLVRFGVYSVVVLVAIFTILEIVGTGGQIRFYGKWLECGRRPLAARGSGFFNAQTPYYVTTPTLSLLRAKQTYFCSEKEAELRGFSAQSTSPHYPHLTPEELKQQQAPRFDGE